MESITLIIRFKRVMAVVNSYCLQCRVRESNTSFNSQALVFTAPTSAMGCYGVSRKPWGLLLLLA
jgi:hypothetical protein